MTDPEMEKSVYEALILCGPMTAREVMRFLPSSISTARRVIRSLQERKKIHVSEYRQYNSRGKFTAVWSAGYMPFHEPKMPELKFPKKRPKRVKLPKVKDFDPIIAAIMGVK